METRRVSKKDYEKKLESTAEERNKYLEALNYLIEIKNSKKKNTIISRKEVEQLKSQIVQDFSVIFGADLRKTIDSDIKTLEFNLNVSEIKEIDFFEFANTEHEDSWLVQGLMPIDLFFINAAAKTGKSDFMINLVRCLVTNEDFLGLPVKQGSVLIFQLEESNGSIKNKAVFHGFTSNKVKSKSGNNAVKMFRKLDLTQHIDFIEEKVKEHKPVAVFIDTLLSSMPGDISPNQTDYAVYLRQLHSKICIAYNVAVVVLHHNNKNGQMAGNYSIPSVGGGYYSLARVENEPNVTELKIVSRELGGKTLKLERYFKNYIVHYKVLSEANENENIKYYKNQILRLLFNGDVYTEAEIKQAIKIDNSLLEEIIISLLQQYLISIVRDEDDVPSFYISESSRVLLRKSEYFRNLNAVIELANTISEYLKTGRESEILPYLATKKQEYKNEYKDIGFELYKSLTPEEQLQFSLIRFPSKYHKTNIKLEEENIEFIIKAVKIEAVTENSVRYLYNIYDKEHGQLVKKDLTESDIKKIYKLS